MVEGGNWGCFVTKEIRIYIEGGGDSKTIGQPLRLGFQKFFRDILQKCRAKNIRLKIISRGGRDAAFDDFKTALRTYPEAFNILLVDAEGPVEENFKPWEHLKKRVGDEWDKPKGVNDDHCHLMVETMEAWFMADLEALEKYYGKDLKRNLLPRNPKVEDIPKEDLKKKLKAATPNREYHEIRHASDLLELIDVAKVRKAAPHCNHLFKTLENEINKLWHIEKVVNKSGFR